MRLQIPIPHWRHLYQFPTSKILCSIYYSSPVPRFKAYQMAQCFSIRKSIFPHPSCISSFACISFAYTLEFIQHIVLLNYSRFPQFCFWMSGKSFPCWFLVLLNASYIILKYCSNFAVRFAFLSLLITSRNLNLKELVFNKQRFFFLCICNLCIVNY